ncbi:MAG: hypothetical protein H5U02_11690 [Clostridia bacterium]|nr:hypothetical protein [Clostridia bacterium]
MMAKFKARRFVLTSFGVCLVLLLLAGGCGSDSGSTASPAPGSSPGDGKSEEGLLSKATHATVMTVPANWESDAEEDGIIVYPDLKDANDQTVQYEGVQMKVDIEIWTTKMGDDFKTKKDRQVYAGSGTIDSWKDGNFMFTGSGIKVPFSDMKVRTSDDPFGLILVRVHLPNGKVLEAQEDMGVALKPTK